tara:strand:- start:119 stop:1267 length:1149 start_codon:yes stop_codon:yes gene_type:complete
MKNNNLHISMTPFTHESRVLKEVNTISSQTDIEEIYIAALHENDLLQNEKISDQISLKRFILKTRNFPKNTPFQLIKYVEFIFKTYFFYRKKNIKVINIHTLALLPLGVFLKYSFGAKLIYDTHELETETRNLKGFKKLLVKKLEAFLIHECDGVICVNKSIGQWYQERYKMENTPTVVLNTPRFKKFKEKKDLFREEFSIDKKAMICLYQGGLTTGRNIETLLTAFSENNDPSCVIVLMGFGPLEDTVKRYAKIHSNIFFKQAVSQKDLIHYTSSADIGFVLIDKGSLSYELSLPNKLFEYAMAGLGIIASDNFEIKNYVERYNSGLCLSEVNPIRLNDILKKIKNEELNVFSKNALIMFQENNWEHQENVLIDIYKKVLL